MASGKLYRNTFKKNLVKRVFRVRLRLENSSNILFQTYTNARSALKPVATMPPALTPKVPLTVVANQGTEEMATTVPVDACTVSFL